jgi:transcriptional regulator with XRE-family HTH domain
MGQFRDQELLVSIGLAFKELRSNIGLSQEQVFNDTGLHIGRIETAKTNLTISTINQLCKYYEIPLKDFFKVVKS